MSKSINLIEQFLDTLQGFEDGEYVNESVLNRPVTQLGNNTMWLKSRVAQLAQLIESIQEAVEAGGSGGPLDITTLDSYYERKITKRTGFNLSLADQNEIDSSVPGKLAESNHNHDSKYEIKFTKKTGFNKDFGTTAGTVVEGNDSRLSDTRTPKTHTHDVSELRTSGAINNDVLIYNGTRWIPGAVPQSQPILTWSSITGKPTTSLGYGITDVYTKADTYTRAEIDTKVQSSGSGTAASTGIVVTNFTSGANQTSFVLPSSDAVFKVTMNGVDLEASAYSRTNQLLSVPSAVAGSIINAYQQGAQAGIVRQDFTTTQSGNNSFTLSGSGPAFAVSVNGIDLAASEWSQSSNIVTLNYQNVGSTVIILRTRGF